MRTFLLVMLLLLIVLATGASFVGQVGAQTADAEATQAPASRV